MPETIVSTTYGLGGYDPSKPNNNIIEQITAEISDEQLLFEALSQNGNDYHIKGIQAYNNWASLTVAQKDVVLKEMLGSMLSVLERLGYFRIT